MATTERRAARLVRELCARIVPEAPEGARAQLLDHALKILNSHIAAHPDVFVANTIKRHLSRAGRTGDAAAFSELHVQLTNLPILRKHVAILQLLFAVSCDRAADAEDAAGDSIVAHPAGTDALYARAVAAPLLPPGPPPPASATNVSFGVGERALIADVLFAMQGIQGTALTYSPSDQSFHVDPKASIPLPMRDVTLKLAELGSLFRQLDDVISDGRAAPGLVAQACRGALQRERGEFFRLLAVLEGQLHTDTPSLTLRRLLVWTAEPLHRMRLLLAMAQRCAALKGGALVSALHAFTLHGDAAYAQVAAAVLREAATPLWIMLLRWIYEGELDDPHEEFFVATEETPLEELWSKRYTLRSEMLPTFISPPTARRILLSGKSIVFMRAHGGSLDELPGRALLRQAIEAPQHEGLEAAVETAYTHAGGRLLSFVLATRGLNNHLRALRCYLVLGQGDLIRHLVDILSPELSKPAESLLKHSLTALLDTAIRATNAQYDDADILRRLDVQLMEPSPGDLGWDVFSLVYNLDGPACAVIDAAAMMQYHAIFTFLWRVKRMEHVLTSAWQQYASRARSLASLPELRSPLHQCACLRSEMLHFINQVQYYFVFEVLECAYDELHRSIARASDLDDVIAAHARFLADVTRHALLGPESQALLSQLRSICDLALKFTSTQESLCAAGVEEVARRNRMKAGAYGKQLSGRWAVSAPPPGDGRPPADFGPQIAFLRKLAASFREMVVRFQAMLNHSPDGSLHSLSFRIDFNEFYARATPRPAAGARPTSTPTG